MTDFPLHRVAAAILALALLGGTTSLLAADKKTPKPATVDVATLNPIARAASQRGVKSCLNRINQVGNFLGQGVDLGTFLFNAPKEGEKHLFSASMESAGANSMAYASATFTPVGSDGCGALYEAVSWWPGNCLDVAAKVFGEMKLSGPLLKNLQVLEGPGSLRVFLMPAGPGCVSIKKEVIF